MAEKKLTKSEIHSGHRYRMRQRFMANGLKGFADHNILEMLLFYSIPRKDTNEIAHALLERFGSLDRVLEASIEDLKKVDGISDYSACLIGMILPIYRRYSDHLTNAKRTFDTSAEIVEYIKSQYVCDTNEKIIMLCFDARLNLINCVVVGEGDVGGVNFNIRKVLETALEINISAAVIAHNHPHGIAAPSSADIETTCNIANMLRSINVKLLDHIIVAHNDTYALSNNPKVADYLKGLRGRDR